MKFFRLICWISVSLMIGCSTLNDHFTCHPAKGMPCQSIDKVNAKIEALQENDSLSSQALPPHLIAWLMPYEDRNGYYHGIQQLAINLNSESLEKMNNVSELDQ